MKRYSVLTFIVHFEHSAAIGRERLLRRSQDLHARWTAKRNETTSIVFEMR